MLLAVLLLVPSLFAQSVTGTLVGTVKDSTGVIPGARIVITNQGTGIAWPTVANPAGDYVVPNLPAGTYAIRVEHPGYRAATM